MAEHFRREIEQLRESLAAQGRRVRKMLEDALRGLLELDLARADQVIAEDHDVDMAEVRFEENCLKLLALYHPVAGDLRLIAACLKVNDTLERVADHAANLARLTPKFRDSGLVSFPRSVSELSRLALTAFDESLQAFLAMDRVKALEVHRGDDRIDRLDEAIGQEAIEIGRSNVRHALLLQRVGRELERVGDLMTNIAEDTIYLVTGEIVRHRMNMQK